MKWDYVIDLLLLPDNSTVMYLICETGVFIVKITKVLLTVILRVEDLLHTTGDFFCAKKRGYSWFLGSNWLRGIGYCWIIAWTNR